ncbi:hypothetical protein EJ03DRAFT_95864 [Teratosphaeria nubilosa]|uniref:BZIP domain-containing protein n=1 Tax=Teratosphaeria nubilosa TaxID=161662 RepID=A0A6G1LAE1_9PEZI|nr:hypothetical protein EJ03DRAFT_95864 [Teratosphaeria nubilosa]
MSRPATLKTEVDMDSFFDFTQSTTQPSPAAASSKNEALSPFDRPEERQSYSGPSHDYNQYKQQVGLPVGSMANMPMGPSMYDGYNSGIDMTFDGGFGNGWSTGIDVDSDMGMDFNTPTQSMPAMFFPPQNDSPADNFVNPTTIGGDEPVSNVGRLWPGMHSQQAQQAAMRKAQQTQAMQQRQMKLQAQHAQYRQLAQPTASSQQQQQVNSKRSSHAAEPHVEERISRLLQQMRQNSAASAGDDAGSPSGNMLPHIARMKKDEEEMDEDERLLNSEEGKKLSSKERRQLRNKVSARAFRSRRKEYIGQLEGEVALKVQEANNLRQENNALMHENDRYRNLIETLLRHPAFTPFINDISNDPAVLGMPQPQSQMHAPPPQQQPSSQPTPQPQQPQPQQPDMKPDFLNFDASQLQVPNQQSQSEQQQIGLAMVPEENFSKLNLGGFQSRMDFNSYNTVNAYAVTSVPSPNPVTLLADSPFCPPATHSTTSASSTASLDILLAKLDRAAIRIETQA